MTDFDVTKKALKRLKRLLVQGGIAIEASPNISGKKIKVKMVFLNLQVVRFTEKPTIAIDLIDTYRILGERN